MGYLIYVLKFRHLHFYYIKNRREDESQRSREVQLIGGQMNIISMA